MHARTTTLPSTDFRRLGDHSWHDKATCSSLDPQTADQLFFPTPAPVRTSPRPKHCAPSAPYAGSAWTPPSKARASMASAAA
ncbi:hypothetical protein [Streptomyces nondiastaticus]|uniref:Uncharacterized protein n=1 Tax=Streptomyces nondiastaticus TaxID=3154512 RepID=A0ABW6TVR2_9ACTN